VAIEYVGGTAGAGTSNGYAVSLDGTLTGGRTDQRTFYVKLKDR
jgi:hypothetical protein